MDDQPVDWEIAALAQGKPEKKKKKKKKIPQSSTVIFSLSHSLGNLSPRFPRGVCCKSGESRQTALKSRHAASDD
jgi:hypothetical protein